MTDWAAYFADYRAARDAESRAAADIEDEPPTLLSDDANVAVSGMPAKLVALVSEAGWRLRTRRTVIAHPAVLYKTGENKGAVRIEPKIVSHLYVTARHPIGRLRLGFTAEWVEGVTPTGKPSLKFMGARVWDPVGKPVELYFDYTPSTQSLRQHKDEPDWAWKQRVERAKAAAAQMNREYNTGDDYIVREYPIGSKKDFDLWLEESLALAPTN